MKLKNKKKFLVFFLIISSYCYSGSKDSWVSKPTYDAVPDSLKKYDVVNIFYKNQIEIKSGAYLEINYTIHQKTIVFSQKGLEIYPHFFIPDLKLLEKVRARTIKPDGSSVDLKRGDIKVSTEGYGAGLCKFVVPGANIGDEIELLISYTVRNYPQIEDIFFHRETFTMRSELLISLTDNIKIETKSYNNLSAPKSNVTRNQRSYLWVLNNLEKIGRNNKIIIHNDLPFLRVAIRSVLSKNWSYIPIDFSSWNEYRKLIHFNEYVGHRLSYDANLGSFIAKHLGAESANLGRKERFDNLVRTINFINDSITLFDTQDTLELNMLLGEHLKKNRIPSGSIQDLYCVLLDMTYFEYYLCLGRNRYLGDIDLKFVSRNQVTDVFFAFEFDKKYHYIFPKTYSKSYNLGEIPNELEGSKAIVFARKGPVSAPASVLNLPVSLKANNTKTINTFAYVNLAENNFHERTKLIATGAWSTIYRNGYKSLLNDSVASSDIYKFIFNTSEDLVDSLVIERSEFVAPFVFTMKFNKNEKNGLILLNDSLKMMPLNHVISHFIPDSYSAENKQSNFPISFHYLDNIKYYLIFDKDVKIVEQGTEPIYFENEFGIFDLQIKQLNPRTIFVFSKVILNKSNLNTLDCTPLYELGNKVRDARDVNLSFKVIK